jgi:serine/threonine protein kinase
MIELGRQFGLYVIKQMVSSSDSYVCCKAEDPFFNREVALKVYPKELFAGDENLARVENLLERLAVLDHPSIAPIYDSGIEGDYYYYTSVACSDSCLAEQLTGPMSTTQVLRLAAELTQALDYALEHELGVGELSMEKIFFDSEGRAVLSDFGIDSGIKQILASGEQAEKDPDEVEINGSVAESLRGVGELLLRLALGPAADLNQRIDDLVAKVEDPQLKKLLGRFLLPGEWRFASYAELLEELAGFSQLAALLKGQPDPPQSFDVFSDPSGSSAELPDEQTVVEIRRLVAENNLLQQSLDEAVYARNLAENKASEKVRDLTAAQEMITRAQEESNVAWELVAGQKSDRWRPVVWSVGGFVIGFLLSGSYGYYYSEQTRNELLAKMQANEELIKTAAWRPAEPASVAKTEQQAAPDLAAPVVTPDLPLRIEAKPVSEAEAAVKIAPSVAIVVAPVKEVSQQWWPAGNEFSPTAAIPVEQIKAALGLNAFVTDDGLSAAIRQEVLTVVSRWADSWSSQDLGQYFSLYSENYRPELGRSRDEWRDLRRQRLTKPQFIELNIDNIRLRQIGANRIQVKMKQSYRSDFYQDRILKSINLIKENGTWRILMERSLGMVDDIVGG